MNKKNVSSDSAFTPTTVSFRSICENVESPVFSYSTREMSGPKVKEFDSIRGVRREDSPSLLLLVGDPHRQMLT